jgi:hypothetical protein
VREGHVTGAHTKLSEHYGHDPNNSPRLLESVAHHRRPSEKHGTQTGAAEEVGGHELDDAPSEAFAEAQGREDQADMFVEGNANLHLPDIEHLRLRSLRGGTVELHAPDLETLAVQGESARVVVQHSPAQLHEIDAHRIVGDFELLLTASQDLAVFGGRGKNSIAIRGDRMSLVTTGSHDDIVRTGDGDDLIGLGAGDDRVEAGGGYNWITLGRGADRVVIADEGETVASPRRGITTITDFKVAEGDAIAFAFDLPRLTDAKLSRTDLVNQGAQWSPDDMHREAVANGAGPLFWFQHEADTYVGIDNAARTLVRLIGLVDLDETSVCWGANCG